MGRKRGSKNLSEMLKSKILDVIRACMTTRYNYSAQNCNSTVSSVHPFWIGFWVFHQLDGTQQR